MNPIAKEDLLRHLIAVLPEQIEEEILTLLTPLCSQFNMELQFSELHMKDNGQEHIDLEDIACILPQLTRWQKRII